jgi:hypothetical protein
MRFKKNFHIATVCRAEKIAKLIEHYPKQFPTPKYLLFIKQFIEAGWQVKLYKAGVSKYVFVYNQSEIYKIRFSNHKPLYSKEIENDCDFYVGISHTQVSTTDEIIKKILG